MFVAAGLAPAAIFCVPSMIDSLEV